MIFGGGGEKSRGFATRGVEGLPKAAVGLPKFGPGLAIYRGHVTSFGDFTKDTTVTELQF